jgi:hypothetical protein
MVAVHEKMQTLVMSNSELMLHKLLDEDPCIECGAWHYKNNVFKLQGFRCDVCFNNYLMTVITRAKKSLEIFKRIK